MGVNDFSFVENQMLMIIKKYFMQSTAILVVLLSLFISKVSAQDSVKNLTLNEAVEATLKFNKGIQLAKLDESITAANYKQTEAVYLPNVGLSYTAMSTNNPLNAFGFKLQQSIISQNDFNPALLNNPHSTADFITKLEVQQPLLNMDMLYMRKGAKKQMEVYEYKTQRTKEYLTYEVQKAYLQLQLSYEAVKVLSDALQTIKVVYNFTDSRFKQGLIQKSDLLNAQVQVTTVESNLAKAQSNIRNASDYLSLMMGNKVGVIYKADIPLTTSELTADTTQKLPFTRSDFVAMQKAIDASDLMIKSSKMSYFPKLNAFGNYQYNNNHLLGFGANAYLIGASLSWDIFKGNKTKNTIIIQKLERDKLVEQLAQQKDQSQLELNKAYRDLADSRFEINQEKVSVQQAAESLRILQNRYQQGLLNTTDILMSQSQLLQQRFALAQAQFTFNVTECYIQLLTSITNK